MFKMVLGPSGYEWACTHEDCSGHGWHTNAAEAALDAVRHRDQEHPESVYSHARGRATQDVFAWLAENGVGEATVSRAKVMQLVNTIAHTLGHKDQDAPLPTLAAVADWGKNPLTMQNMGDPRLIEVPAHTGPTRNWTTNHQVRWSVGEDIQMPPEGKGCKAYGARVGENTERCALPFHNPANIKHVFAIGEHVTRIAHN